MSLKKEQSLEEFVYEILLDLLKLDCSGPFRSAVDPVAQQCLNYYDVIKRPMDLTTIKLNFRDDKYKNITEVIADLEQIPINCVAYNGLTHPIMKQCEKFKACLESRFKQLHTKVKQMGGNTTLAVDGSKLDQIDQRKQKKRDPALPPPVDQIRKRVKIDTNEIFETKQPLEQKFTFKNNLETVIKTPVKDTRKEEFDVFLDDLSPHKPDKIQIPINHKSAEKKPEIIQLPMTFIKTLEIPMEPAIQKPLPEKHFQDVEPVNKIPRSFKDNLLIKTKSDIERTSEIQYAEPIYRSRQVHNDESFIKLDREVILSSFEENQKHKLQKQTLQLITLRAKKFIMKVFTSFLQSLQGQREKLVKIAPGVTFNSLYTLEQGLRQMISLNPQVEWQATLHVLSMSFGFSRFSTTLIIFAQNIMRLVFQDLQDMYRYCELICKSLNVLRLVGKRLNLDDTPQHADIFQQRVFQFERELLEETKQHFKPPPPPQEYMQPISIPIVRSLPPEDADQFNDRTFRNFITGYNERFQRENIQSLVNAKRLYKWKRKPQLESSQPEPPLVIQSFEIKFPQIDDISGSTEPIDTISQNLPSRWSLHQSTFDNTEMRFGTTEYKQIGQMLSRLAEASNQILEEFQTI